MEPSGTKSFVRLGTTQRGGRHHCDLDGDFPYLIARPSSSPPTKHPAFQHGARDKLDDLEESGVTVHDMSRKITRLLTLITASALLGVAAASATEGLRVASRRLGKERSGKFLTISQHLCARRAQGDAR